MAKIIVLGGGRQGRIVAQDLAADHEVTVADRAAVTLDGVHSLRADVTNTDELVALLRQFDLVVGALPSKLGFAAAQACIAAKRHCVDLAFYTEDPFLLDAPARRAGVAILPDCGVAPGLSNLIAGRALTTRRPHEIHIMVGGVARDPKRPYGYVVTFAPEDLADEYVRPARIIRDGRITSVPAMSEVERIKVEGLGELEAFLTDGLRTLLSTKNIANMTEKTIRWPGHLEAIKPLLASGTLAREVLEKCSEGEDVVVFRMTVDKETVTMVDVQKGGVSAMARTTALACAVFARWVASGKLRFAGLVPPERLAQDHEAYQFILDQMKLRGVSFNPPYPFVRPDPYR